MAGVEIRPGAPPAEHHPACAGGSHPEWVCPLALGPATEMDRLWELPESEESAANQGRGSGRAGATTGTALRARTSAVEVEPACDLPGSVAGLTWADAGNLRAVLNHEVARNTVKNYRIQWRRFIDWALGKGMAAIPASPAQVAAYLAERIEEYGHKPATLRVAAAAIAFVHRTVGLDDPCASVEVKRTLRGATRKAGREQKQAEGLTAEVLGVIQETARNRRPGRGGRLESAETAESRGNLDIALIRLMRDAMLRVSEAAVLTWRDIESVADGSGRLLIRRSKTDPEGGGAVAFVSVPTMAALKRIRRGALDSDSVYGLRPNQISRRIKKAAQAVGLGDGFSGHSPRVGMAQDLARAGVELPGLMTAGRWRSPTMPAYYTRNETAAKGAVAQFYGQYRRSA